jgi:hypothetical protein
VVDVAVIHGVIALDNAGIAHCEPTHHQVVDVRFCLSAGSEAQGVAAPLPELSAMTSGLKLIGISPIRRW